MPKRRKRTRKRIVMMACLAGFFAKRSPQNRSSQNICHLRPERATGGEWAGLFVVQKFTALQCLYAFPGLKH